MRLSAEGDTLGRTIVHLSCNKSNMHQFHGSSTGGTMPEAGTGARPPAEADDAARADSTQARKEKRPGPLNGLGRSWAGSPAAAGLAGAYLT
jgi:hypothetical protein